MNKPDLRQGVLQAAAAVKAAPKDARAHNALGLELLKVGNSAEAEKAFRYALTLQPRSALLYQHLGLALQNQGKSVDALNAYLTRLQIEPNIDGYWAAGKLCLALNRRSEALECFEKGYDLAPNAPTGLILLAQKQIEEGAYADSEETLKRVIALEPRLATAHEMLGIRLQERGAFEEAKAHFDAAIAIVPTAAMPQYRRLLCARATVEDAPRLEHIEEALRRGAFNREGTRYLHYGLGKCFDDLGNFAKAMQHFDAANKISKEGLRAQGRSFDLAAVSRDYDRIISECTAEYLSVPSDGASMSELPVLVVGMIRSGTTLVEQILSRHSDIAAGGELSFWNEEGAAYLREGIGVLDGAKTKDLSSKYLLQLEELGGGSARVTDKMPPNYGYLGVIRKILPNARIIHCRRNPADTCLSLYMTPNRVGNDRADIVALYRQYIRLMEHWRSVLPSDRFLEVDYEELVAGPEPTTRRMIEFVGLPWSERCLSPQESKTVVRTPSLWQVRQPIYRTSVGRWRNYENLLGEFKELLD